LESHKTLLSGSLLKLFVFVAFDQVIDPPLAEKIGLGLFCRPGCAVCRALVHPIHAIDALFSARRLKLVLQLFLGPLLLDLVDALLGALTLRERFLFFVPYLGLVSLETRVPRLLQIQVSATHGCDGEGLLMS
jgi:hypothetical protein